MKKQVKLSLCLTAALLLLTSCASQKTAEEFPDITQAIGPTATPTPVITQAPVSQEQPLQAGQSIFDQNPFDVISEDQILAEENKEDPNEKAMLEYESGLSTMYPYAGSTPIPLDPVDKPTPTPRPELSFSYVAINVPSLGISFEGPDGWEADTSSNELYILREPEYAVKEGQRCEITISVEPLSSKYNEKELKAHVKQRLDSLYTADIQSWKPSTTATRHLMKSNGIYANYTATKYDGTKIGGRIHYACIDKKLYGLEIVYPLGYRDDYLNVLGKIRTTMTKLK